MATLIRVVVIFFVSLILVLTQSEWKSPLEISNRTLIFLILSGVATGFSWLCGYRALQLGQASVVSPVDKLSVLLVMVMVMGVLFLGEKLSTAAAEVSLGTTSDTK